MLVKKKQCFTPLQCNCCYSIVTQFDLEFNAISWHKNLQFFHKKCVQNILHFLFSTCGSEKVQAVCWSYFLVHWSHFFQFVLFFRCICAWFAIGNIFFAHLNVVSYATAMELAVNFNSLLRACGACEQAAGLKTARHDSILWSLWYARHVRNASKWVTAVKITATTAGLERLLGKKGP